MNSGNAMQILKETPADDMPVEGFLRLVQIVGRKANPAKNQAAIPPIIPISKTSFLSGVKKGIFPAPVYLGERTPLWKKSDIRRFIEQS
ncbi:MAG TPA: hypothetical protein PLB95_00735 [Syntrophales bacterium]|nr:transcriptional regulator [Pseudomonadota bacterium]HPX80397.1 hypothetical protein [Syntrophales bacterium]